MNYPIKPIRAAEALSNLTPSDIDNATNVYCYNAHTGDVVITLSTGGTVYVGTKQSVTIRKEPTATLIASVDAVIQATKCGIL